MTDEDNTTAPEANRATVITFSSSDQMVGALGANDEVLRILQGVYPSVELHVRGNELRITGEAAAAGRTTGVGATPGGDELAAPSLGGGKATGCGTEASGLAATVAGGGSRPISQAASSPSAASAVSARKASRFMSRS